MTNCDTRSKFVGLDKLANPIDGVRGKAFVKLRAIAGNVCESKPIKSWDLKRMQNDQKFEIENFSACWQFGVWRVVLRLGNVF